MQVKDMFLKKIKNNLFIFFLTLFVSQIINANNIGFEDTLNYLKNLKNSSVSFIQNDENNLSTGKIYLGDTRVRVEYLDPQKILIILGSDKAMYYNYELDEDEFFNPKDTSAWFFYEIFNNPIFFYDSDFATNDNTLIIKKDGVINDDYYNLKIYFETKPMLLRKIRLELGGNIIDLSFFGHTKMETFNKNFFKLINPTFFD
tara:strand:+ start:9799 stop:10404 length:606 start_codon:yes stop_codon:yes gene_type:complete